MAKTRPPYTPEFRRQMIELVHARVAQAAGEAGRAGEASPDNNRARGAQPGPA
jgi:hypothetical protein